MPSQLTTPMLSSLPMTLENLNILGDLFAADTGGASSLDSGFDYHRVTDMWTSAVTESPAKLSADFGFPLADLDAEFCDSGAYTRQLSTDVLDSSMADCESKMLRHLFGEVQTSENRFYVSNSENGSTDKSSVGSDSTEENQNPCRSSLQNDLRQKAVEKFNEHKAEQARLVQQLKAVREEKRQTLALHGAAARRLRFLNISAATLEDLQDVAEVEVHHVHETHALELKRIQETSQQEHVKHRRAVIEELAQQISRVTRKLQARLAEPTLDEDPVVLSLRSWAQDFAPDTEAFSPNILPALWQF
uniref:Uncharacterized protein n=1 Tax=Eutreptiella gymnastica TaxID=73025 RepID=A0A7S1IFP8_9EUGL